MTTRLLHSAFIALLLMASASFALAQKSAYGHAVFTITNPAAWLTRQIDFTTNAPYELKTGQLLLPPGNYILYQLDPTDPTLFALYEDNLAHSPVVMVRTMFIDYGTIASAKRTRILFSREESDDGTPPVIAGWTIRGQDGWKIVSVVENKALANHEAGASAK